MQQREPLRLNSKLLQFITATERSAVVEASTATAKSSAVVEACSKSSVVEEVLSATTSVCKYYCMLLSVSLS